ncbi:hypothetical protein Tco_1380671 [Tanacetum coccineum]
MSSWSLNGSLALAIIEAGIPCLATILFRYNLANLSNGSFSLIGKKFRHWLTVRGRMDVSPSCLAPYINFSSLCVPSARDSNLSLGIIHFGLYRTTSSSRDSLVSAASIFLNSLSSVVWRDPNQLSYLKARIRVALSVLYSSGIGQLSLLSLDDIGISQIVVFYSNPAKALSHVKRRSDRECVVMAFYGRVEKKTPRCIWFRYKIRVSLSFRAKPLPTQVLNHVKGQKSVYEEK